MKLIFMLEEPSMKVLLDGILPRLLPEGVDFLTIPHGGKRELELSLPRKLRAWKEPDVAFIVVHDQDSNECVELKRELQGICAMSGKQVLVRIACRELEAWYWGDLAAVSKAYGIDLKPLSAKRKYRNPDSNRSHWLSGEVFLSPPPARARRAHRRHSQVTPVRFTFSAHQT